MANVEVQLDVKAEYKQAYAAIQLLGKALDAVQQRAKVALSVSGGAQGGSQGSGSTGEAETQQKAAVEALSAAMKDAAAAAATLAESVAKLTPALEAMGPQAEQVQQVLTLAEHYKQLAAAMGVAADAAAKYNASGAQQGETDARIQKLMEENQKLMELLSNIRAEYAEIVKRNAELNRTKTAREEAARSAREELEAEQDLSYQMALSVMSKRELIAEIQRLTKEREEAAKVKDQKLWEEKTEELKLARQALAKLRQEQQLSRIAWLQQAQTAQQMGQSVRTLAEGFTNFGESVENGTVNLTGMVSAVTSLSLAIKAGLGPLGWALAAVELLTTAWNMYAKSQKEIKKADEERKKRIDDLTSSLNDAYAANKKLKEATWVEDVADSWTSHYENLNQELQKTVELAEKAYKTQVLQMSLQEKEDDFYYKMEGEKLKLKYLNGEITKEEMDSALDSLKVEKAELKVTRATDKGRAKIEKEEKLLKQAQEAKRIAEEDLQPYNAYAEMYKLKPEQLREIFKSYETNQSKLGEKTTKSDELDSQISEKEKLVASLLKRVQLGDESATFSYSIEASKLEKLKADKAQLNKELTIVSEAASEAAAGIFDQLGWLPESLEEYTAAFKEFTETVKPIKTQINNAQTKIETAEKNVETAKKDLDDSLSPLLQNVRQTKESVILDSQIREAKRNKDKRDSEKKEAERREKAEAKRKEQEEKARKEREQMQRAVVQEAIAEETSLPRGLKGFINGGAYNMLKDGLSQKEAEMYEKAFKAAAKAKNKALFEMLEFLLKQADEDGKTTNQIMAKLKQTRKNTEKLVD